VAVRSVTLLPNGWRCFPVFYHQTHEASNLGKGLVAALKADTLSLTAWQVGMYGWMAIVIFVLFGEIPKTNPVFGFMMQIAMCVGFLLAFPAIWWLVRKQIKEQM
jgi:hypothetical protein